MNIFLIGLGIVFALGFFAGRLSSPSVGKLPAGEALEESMAEEPLLPPAMPTKVAEEIQFKNREQALLQQIAQLNHPCPPVNSGGEEVPVFNSEPEPEPESRPEEDPNYIEYPDHDQSLDSGGEESL